MPEFKICPACRNNCNTEVINCNSCGYPFSATKAEQSNFIGQLILKKSTISESYAKIKRARIALWVVGAYFILFSLYFIYNFSQFPFEVFLPDIFFGLLFIGFGFLTFRLPIISIIIPLILLITYWVITAVYNTNDILSGILFKIAILGIMFYALVSTIRARKIAKESDFLKNRL